MTRWIALAVLSLLGPSPLLAQAPATPDAAPATTQRQPYRVTPPQGFVRVDAAGRVAFAKPADEAWVRETLASVTPATMPSTMPADLAERLVASRDRLASLLEKRLGYADRAAFDAFYDQTLLPGVRGFEKLTVPAFYLVGNTDDVKQALRSGWTNPRYYFNRAADTVNFEAGMSINPGGENDEVLLPALHEPGATPQQQRDRLVQTVRAMEADLAASSANRAHFVAQVQILEFIREKVFAPLELRDDQAWLATGAAGMVSAELITAASGMALEELIVQMIAEPNNTPFPASAVNLTRPMRTDELRPQFVPFYLDAVRRKSTAVVFAWMRQGGSDDALPKLLESLRKQKPEGGNALLETMRQINGVDVSGWVQ
jgi:hypothetical protein